MSISFVIPNYNGASLLDKNLSKIIEVLEHSKQKVEVIIVDDASKDNSVEVIEKFISTNTRITITLLKKTQNEGFSSTINDGVKKAKFDFVYLLNSDVVPKENFLDYFEDYFKDNLVFAVGSMDESVENNKKVFRGRGVGKWQRGFLVHNRGEVDANSTLWVSGGSGIFNKAIWEKLGGFDEIYNPFYWEDIDLSYRAIKSGYKVFFESKSIVTHNHEEGSIKTNIAKSKVQATAYRNQIIFVWKNATDMQLLLSHFFWLPYHVIKTVKTGDFLFLQGLLSAALFIPEILKQRAKESKLYKLHDLEIYIN